MAGFPLEGAAFVALFCETLFYGTYAILFSCTVYLWCRKSSTSTTTLGLFIRIPTVLMFTIATINLIMTFVQDYRVFVIGHNDPDALGEEGSRYIVEQLSLDITNCMLADLILTWRAWALFNRNAKVLIAPLILITGSTVMGGAAMSQVSKWRKVDGQNPSLQSIFSPAVAPWIYAMSCLILVTNLLCTGLIAWKVIHHKRTLAQANLSHLASAYQWIALTICESGAVYLTCWVLFLILAALGHPAFVVMLHCLTQIVGIVPTLIVVLVSVKADSASLHEKFSSISAGITGGPVVSHRLSFAEVGPDGRGGAVGIISHAEDHELHLRKPGRWEGDKNRGLEEGTSGSENP
ncbi:hypothetical protein DL96DRAFT_1620730 [Flagelloscypha sp. PMI_526]|nr:hypothetical protein DL96DRAFT_1620730 [Flagelloscypha sp. PMI_526]